MQGGKNRNINVICKEDLSKLKVLIEELEKDVNSVDFLEPVDYVKYGLEDYPLIIKRPMDLSTIKVKYILI